MRPLATRVQPLLHAAFAQMRRLTTIVGDAKSVEQLLAQRASLTDRIGSLRVNSA
jgi:hypothetical protein